MLIRDAQHKSSFDSEESPEYPDENQVTIKASGLYLSWERKIIFTLVAHLQFAQA